MTTDEFDAPHLGVLIGDPKAGRIIALSTSGVFHDRSLLRTFWGTDGADIDSGLQAHLYTRPNDVLVIRVPADADDVVQTIRAAIALNREIWISQTGLELVSSEDQIVLASDGPPHHRTGPLPPNVTWHVGSLLDAAATRYRMSGEAFLAFVFDIVIAEKLGLGDDVASRTTRQARAATHLMDKNLAMATLRDAGIDCADSYPFDTGTPVTRILALPDDKLYLFKPAGGAAGIGVFPANGRGVDSRTIYHHVRRLRRDRRLPQRFQIQEFLAGELIGASAVLRDDDRFEVLEVHRQSIDAEGHFAGARWSRGHRLPAEDRVASMYRQLAAVGVPSPPALVCLDIIDGRVIEVNPRVTAAAPIAHLLSHEAGVSHGMDGRPVNQIDINTQIQIPWDTVRAGHLLQVIEDVRKRFGTLVLPQGLNPFGRTRVVFVNDDEQGSAQRAFVERVGR